MERLTTWNGSKYVLPQGRTDGKSNWRRIAEKLAQYEDIGSPDEIRERLAERDKIKVIVKHPECKPMLCDIDNTLEEMQMIVGGYIEAAIAAPDVVAVCNEEGRLMGLPHNTKVGGIDFVGTIILVGSDGDEFADVPEYVVKMYELG